MDYTDNQHDEVTNPIILEIWQKQIIDERLTDYYNNSESCDDFDQMLDEI